MTFAMLFLIAMVISVCATETDANDLADEILSGKVSETGSKDIQEWIDNKMTPPSDGSEWYVMCLHQSGNYGFSKYAARLIDYLKKNTVSNVVSKQKFALTLLACNVNADFINEVKQDNLDNQGVMTYIYALHLCNNGIQL